MTLIELEKKIIPECVYFAVANLHLRNGLAAWLRLRLCDFLLLWPSNCDESASPAGSRPIGPQRFGGDLGGLDIVRLEQLAFRRTSPVCRTGAGRTPETPERAGGRTAKVQPPFRDGLVADHDAGRRPDQCDLGRLKSEQWDTQLLAGNGGVRNHDYVEPMEGSMAAHSQPSCRTMERCTKRKEKRGSVVCVHFLGGFHFCFHRTESPSVVPLRRTAKQRRTSGYGPIHSVQIRRFAVPAGGRERLR